MNKYLRISLVFIFVAFILVSGMRAAAQSGVVAGHKPQTDFIPIGTAFTYQGQLKGPKGIINGSCDAAFRLYDADTDGSVVGAPITTTLTLVNSLFTVALDFGSSFHDAARWLGIMVRCPAGSGGYVTLTPLQPLTAVPIALALPGLHTTQNNTSPNILGGFAGNWISPTVVGAVIDGGGAVNFENKVFGDFGVVGGGLMNQVVNIGATVSGGGGNQARGLASTVGGGELNTSSGDHASLGGGGNNTASGGYSTLGGGGNNTASGSWSTVSGGNINTAEQMSATVSGGYSNWAFGIASTVGGGMLNTSKGDYSTVGGGFTNFARLAFAVVGGGDSNRAFGAWSTVSGGGNNYAEGSATTIGGGANNQAIQANTTVGGGKLNLADQNGAVVGGGTSNWAYGISSMVGGGSKNKSGGPFSFVGGGSDNLAHGGDSFIGGGISNLTEGSYATIAGGYDNLAFGFYSTVTGGYTNTASSQYATVGGGRSNQAAGDSSTIAGGGSNTTLDMYGTVSGGWNNHATGEGSVIGGGLFNYASGVDATVPGGEYNRAVGAYSFAAGSRASANHQGAFVWSDHSSSDEFFSTADNQFLVRASGGLGVGTYKPSAQLSVSSGGGDAFPQMVIDQSSAGDYVRLRLTVGESYADRWDIGSNTTDFTIYSGHFGKSILSITPGAADYLMMGNGAHLTAGGDWTNNSDRNLKTNIQPVDSRQILNQVLSLPLSTWNYTAEDQSTRHLGPMAQDFYSTFALGSDDRSISTIDPAGVSLAAIQGLYQVIQEKDQRISALEGEVAQLKRSVGGESNPVLLILVSLAVLFSLTALGFVGYIGLRLSKSGKL